MNVPIVDRNVVLFLQTNPFINSHAFLDSIKDALVVQAVFEGWLDGLSTKNCLREIGNDVDECVFITDDVTGRPPALHIWMSWFGHENVAETLSIFWIARAKELQAIHFFEIEK
jgi:hypothetical protein